jgi:hypothetical protein
MDSSCELLRSVDAASASFIAANCSACRTLRSISKGVTFRDVLIGLRLSGGLHLTENTREVHLYIGRRVSMGRLAVHCCDSHLHCCDN